MPCTRRIITMVASLWMASCGSSSDSLFASGGTGGARTGSGGITASDGGSGGTANGGTRTDTGGTLAGGGATGGVGGAESDAAASTSGAPSGSGGRASVDSGIPPSNGGGGSGGKVGSSGGAVGSGGSASTPGTIACSGGPCLGTCCHGALAGVECLPLICPSGGAPLQCDDRADCMTGKLCCGSLSKGSSCATTCTGEQLCRTNDECKSGQCRPLGEDARYSACQG